MPQTLLCPRKHTVPFTDDDRGGEVYCPVCGVACSVPAEVQDGEQPLLCRNGHTVAFAEQERGGEVYCRSCGVVCEVPAAVAPTVSSRRRASVFTATGESHVAARTVGEMPCSRCQQFVSYTVADYGETIYCTKCGEALTVGESLQNVVAARRLAAADTAMTPTHAVRSALSGR